MGTQSIDSRKNLGRWNLGVLPFWEPGAFHRWETVSSMASKVQEGRQSGSL